MWPCVAGVGRCTRACVRAGRTPPGASRSLSAASWAPSLLPLWIASHNRLLSARADSPLLFASLRAPPCVCLRRPSLTHSSLARTSRTRLGARKAAAPGAQLSSRRWGLRQRGPSVAGGDPECCGSRARGGPTPLLGEPGEGRREGRIKRRSHRN